MARLRQAVLWLVLVGVCVGVALHFRPTGQYSPARLSVDGTPHEIGAQAGKANAAVIRQLSADMLRLVCAEAHASPEAVRASAARVAAELSAEDIEELRGLAEGSGAAYEDVAFLNMLYSFSPGRIACRQLAAWGTRTADGELLHARNLDWFDYPGSPLQRHNLILNVKPDDGIEYLCLTWPGLMGVATGTNRDGLSVAFNELPLRRSGTGEPILFTLKRVLRSCSTLDEAVDLLVATKPRESVSVLISDARRKRAVVVEIANREIGIREAVGDLIGNANHATREAGLRDVPTGPAEEPACSVALERFDRLDPDRVIQVMADPRVIQEINLLSVVFVPTSNRMLLSCGRTRAAKGPFRSYTLFH